MLTDGIRIRQVLSNLISNAIKFTPENGKINFDISVLEQNNKNIKLRFLIKDNGIGIPENKIDNIFEPFIQVDNESNRKYEGTGLGLSICSHIVKLLNSRIEILSQIDEGSSFWFDLDLEVCSNNEIVIEKIDKIIEVKKEFSGKILVAEDNTLNQELIKYVLESLGLEYKIVSNGKEALEEYKNNNYDLILMDINMPVLDGIEAFKQIRSYEKENNLKAIPISALTANAIKGDKEKFLDLGMDYYLSKPINIAKVKELFSIYLSSNDKEICKQKNIEKKEIVKEMEKEELTTTSFNKNDAINQLGLDEEIIDMLLDNFFLTLDNDLKNIQDAIDSKNSENIVQTAHYLKGSCANLAKNDAVKILQEIETKAKEGETDFNLKSLNHFFTQIR